MSSFLTLVRKLTSVFWKVQIFFSKNLGSWAHKPTALTVRLNVHLSHMLQPVLARATHPAVCLRWKSSRL